MRSKKTLLVPLVVVGVLLLSACSSGGGSSGGDPRRVEVTALDELRFDPPSVEVGAGETVRFVVTNAGSLPHEFILGDEATQMMHEGQMGGGMSMEHGGADLPALKLDPGETSEATATFEEAGEILFGCHVPGHYDAGMVGTVVVS